MKTKPTRHADGRPFTEEERKRLYDNLQDWISRTLIRAARLKAREIHYERGRSGLTVQFRRGDDVVEALGPYKRYQDKVIPRLNLMGQQGLPGKFKGETGRFITVVDGRESSTPIFHTRARSGERVVVRFTGWKPSRG